jgi:hypothetical protein
MIQSIQHLPEGTKLVGDGITVIAVVGTLVGYLPPLAALATLVWTCIRIYETDTVQRFVAKLKTKSEHKNAESGE